jgi:hypothetical protein
MKVPDRLRRERLLLIMAKLQELGIEAMLADLAPVESRPPRIESKLRLRRRPSWPDEPGASTMARARERVSRPRPPARTPERTIHRVRQSFSTSCGVAVVAMFARVSHDEAMAVLFPKPRREFSTHLYQLKRALDHFGVKYGPRWSRFTSWSEIPTTSLVKVKCETWFHWVIFQRRSDGGWALIDPDPARSGTQRLSRVEIEQYTGVTYMPVEAVRPGASRGSKRRSS